MTNASIPDSGSTANLVAAGGAARPAAQDSDAEITKECVQASPNLPDPANWLPGARFDIDSENGLLVIRNDEYAAVCVLKNGKGVDTDVYGAPTRAMCMATSPRPVRSTTSPPTTSTPPPRSPSTSDSRPAT